MSQDKSSLELLFEKVENLSNTTHKLWNLVGLTKYSEAASAFSVQLVLIGVMIFFAFFLNIGLALLINDYLEKMYLGFFIIAACNLFVAIFISLFLKNTIQLKMKNYLISKYFKKSFTDEFSQNRILMETIEAYKIKQMQEIQLLKEQVLLIESNLQPINLIKNGVSQLTSAFDVKTNMMDIALHWVTHFFNKKSKYIE